MQNKQPKQRVNVNAKQQLSYNADSGVIESMFKKQTIKATDERILYLKKKDKVLAKLIDRKGDIEYYICNEPIKFVIFEIIGQLISTKVASKIFSRFVMLCKNDFSPRNLSTLNLIDIKNLGLTYKKAEYIKSFAMHLVACPSFLEEVAKQNNEQAMKSLIALRGIGKWTAKMYLIFVLGRENFFPFEDVALVRGIKELYKIDFHDKKQLETFGDKWHPYKSLASRYLYEFANEVFQNKPSIAN